MKTNFVKALVADLLLALCGTAHAQAPVAGQPYQVPAGFEAYGSGTGINYGGFSYIIQGDGTMLLAQQGGSPVDPGASSSQPYQIPAGFENSAAGTAISYGGADYVVQGDGTMLLAQQSGYASNDPGPPAGQPYQIPAGYENSAAGTGISYGGADYVVQGDGTMLLSQQPGAAYDAGSSAYTSFYGPAGNTSLILQGQFLTQPFPRGNASRPKGNPTQAQPRYPLTQNRFPVTQNRFPVTQNRFPVTQNRLPITQNRFPVTQNRFPGSLPRNGGGQARLGGGQVRPGGGMARPGGGQVRIGGGGRRR